MSQGQRLSRLESHPLFTSVLRIVKTLSDKGFTAVLAGGCVRDALLGREPKDIDIATNALPDEVERAFVKTLAVGKAFGTIVVVEDGHNFEVTTFRADGPYLDGRHPVSVTFTGAKEDALRRDFTVNALFYDPLKGEVLDYVGGRDDLGLELLRAVGHPEDRFTEDRLRMLRAVRFAGQLGFAIDADSKAAIRAGHLEISKVSVERIFAELRRLLESDFLIKGLAELHESRMTEVFWPEFAKVNIDDLLVYGKFQNWENAFAAVSMAANVDDPEPRLRALKSPKDSIRRIRAQIDAVNAFATGRTTRADRARVLGGEVFAEFLVLAQGRFDEAKIKEWIAEFLEVAQEDGSLPKPLLNGQDLVSEGVGVGKEMGELLRKVYNAQLEARVRTREQALVELRRLRA